MEYTVVIRTLGKAGEKYQRMLDSLKAQTFQPKDIIVYIAEGYNIPKETIGTERYVYVKKGMVAQRALSYDEIEKMKHIFRKMEQETDFGEDILKNMAAVEILTIVNRHFSEKNKHYTYRSDYEDKTIVKALKYINDNFSGSLSLEIVAKNCFISINELCRLFKKHTGTTVTKYILSRRITEAKKMLKNGESVSSVAEKCGFLDYASFIRAFKRTVGVSPGKYKKEDVG